MASYRSLGTLRNVLQSRLGFGASGSSAGANQTLLNAFLQSAQVQFYWITNWNRLTFYYDKTLGASQNLLDYPTELDTERIQKIAIQINDSWIDLAQGLETVHYTTMDNPGPPQRYEKYAQVLLWPISDQTYQVRFWGVKKLERFEQDADLPLIDDELILLHATARAKGHYRHPDAQTWVDDLNVVLNSFKGSNLKRVYNRNDSEAQFEPRPRVI